jgi:hypothetical protein
VAAGDHVAHEALVAGHVDEAEPAAVAEAQAGEAQVDRQPAFLLLLEPVRIDAGQRLDQRCSCRGRCDRRCRRRSGGSNEPWRNPGAGSFYRRGRRVATKMPVPDPVHVGPHRRGGQAAGARINRGCRAALAAAAAHHDRTAEQSRGVVHRDLVVAALAEAVLHRTDGHALAGLVETFVLAQQLGGDAVGERRPALLGRGDAAGARGAQLLRLGEEAVEHFLLLLVGRLGRHRLPLLSFDRFEQLQALVLRDVAVLAHRFDLEQGRLVLGVVAHRVQALVEPLDLVVAAAHGLVQGARIELGLLVGRALLGRPW